MMSSLPPQDVWASGVAARLRLAFSAAADARPAERAELYREEIERAMRNIPREERRGYITALSERFPAWGPIACPDLGPVSPAAESPAHPPAAPEEAVQRTPEDLLSELVAQLDGADAATRQKIQEQIEQAGLSPRAVAEPAPTAPQLEIAHDIARKLGVTDGATLNTDRVLRLAADLIDFSEKIDRLIWMVWRQMNPGTSFTKTHADIRTLVSKSLSSESIPPGQITEALNRTSKLLGAFTAGISRGVSGASGDLWQKFNPVDIEVESSGFSKDKKCWERYKQIFQSYPTWQSLENEMLVRIARDVEQALTAR